MNLNAHNVLAGLAILFAVLSFIPPMPQFVFLGLAVILLGLSAFL